MREKLYNLTLHRQEDLAELDTGFDVEVEPRLRPIQNPSDYDEVKAAVRKAVRGLRPGACVLVGGLGQFQALVMQLPLRAFFVDLDPQARKARGLIEHKAWTRQELFEIENG